MNTKSILMLCCTLVLTMLSNQSQAQQLLLKQTPNQNPKELSYSYMVLTADDNNSKVGEKLLKEIEQQVKSKGLTGLKAVQSLDSLPDVVFMIGESNRIPQEVIASGTYVVTLDAKPSARKAVELLKQRYFSATPPTYSTIFTAGKGYHNYRIPSVVATKDGTIVAFAEARAFYKDQAENDIVSRRSVDGGKTWSDITVVAENGKASLNNPTPTYLPESNTIVLLFQDYPQHTNEGSATKGAVRCLVTTSTDNGQTWSTPKDISASVCPEGATSYCTGPASGIVLEEGKHKGRIVISCNVNAPVWYNYLIYSDDAGKTWHIADGRSSYGTNESQVAEIGKDELLVFARVHKTAGDASFDAPKGWSPWRFDVITRSRALVGVKLSDSTATWGTTQIHEEMPDPNCQGSIIRYNTGDGKFVLITSNPASRHTYIDGRKYEATPPMRVNGSLRYSTDKGATWSVAKRIYGNRFTEYQYSVLTPLANGKVGIIFEANADIKFAVVDLAWLME